MKCTQNIEPLMSEKLTTDDFEMLVVAEKFFSRLL